MPDRLDLATEEQADARLAELAGQADGRPNQTKSTKPYVPLPPFGPANNPVTPGMIGYDDSNHVYPIPRLVPERLWAWLIAALRRGGWL